MTCFNPLKGWRGRARPGVVFDVNQGWPDLPISVPCGQCIGCRLERSRQWAMRCYHEASLYENNCFITLTYSDDTVPVLFPGEGDYPTLRKRDYQLFMKRLRERFGSGIRFYHCGEYGEGTNRPHYHACLFNFDFPDKVLESVDKAGYHHWSSVALGELWTCGLHDIGSVTFESAAYVARYIMKKTLGKDAADRYDRMSYYGEVQRLEPEYTTMSRRPGIGRDWYDEFHKDAFPSDFLVCRGMRMRPPRYYEELLKLNVPQMHVSVKRKRKSKARRHVEDQTPARLRDREIVTEARVKRLNRKLED